MKLSLFKKQMLLMASVTLVFLALGLLASLLVSQMDRQRFESAPTNFVARLIDDISEHYNVSREEAFARVKESNEATSNPVEMEVLDREQAQQLIGPDQQLPDSPYGAVQFGHRDMWHYPARLIRLKGDEEQYLRIIYRPRSSPLRRILNPISAVMMTSIFLASMLSMSLLFYSMRRKAHLVSQIINEMTSGNLSARFPVGKMDETGQLMLEFNKMADEIQRLVETIKSNEQVRMRRLQELAHDLRTPVASLKNLLETLQRHGSSMTAHARDEVMVLALKEVEYFTRLVEDLLFLSQLSEPKYAAEKTRINIATLVEDELERIQTHYPNIHIENRVNPADAEIKGDSHLLRRLFRNAFENAFSFAQSRVEVDLQRDDRGVSVIVRDDGRGFNDTALAGFGEKRGTRSVANNAEGRISVGLGSVIMRAVVQVHGGRLSARNRPGSGAEVEMQIAAE